MTSFRLVGICSFGISFNQSVEQASPYWYLSHEAATARKRFLLLLAFVGSAVCWWPAIIEPSLDFSRWILLALVALISGASILLWGGRGWLIFVAAAAGGSFAGLLSGVILWPWSDGIARSYALIVVVIGSAAATGVALICGLAASLAVRRWPASSGAAKAASWVVLWLCLASGPTLFALTKPLVERRVQRNESIAAIRFASLKKALELTRADRGAADSICDGDLCKRTTQGCPSPKRIGVECVGITSKRVSTSIWSLVANRENICWKHGQKCQGFTAMVPVYSALTNPGMQLATYSGIASGRQVKCRVD